MGGSAAQAGFYYQNNVAALKILESLFFQSDITHIELENYEGGKHIDDVIVYRTTSTQYTQVKWSEDTGNAYTLYNLLTATEEGKKSIFKQLAEGYGDAVKKGKPFTITLFTNKKQSGTKRPSEGLQHGLIELIDNYLTPFKQTTLPFDQVPAYATYKPTVDKIKTETGLSDMDFSAFLRSLEFQFSQPSLAELQQAIKLKMGILGLEESLFDRLLNKIVEWSIDTTIITKNTLLEGLGIFNRFEDKLSHYFKVVDEQYYVANEGLLEQIRRSLAELPGGYIFIEGLPGIGKSTALTKLKQQDSNIAFAYYCFIPDEKAFSEPRQTAASFFRSMCIAIEKNFPDVNLPNKYSGDYQDKLTGHIQALGNRHQKTIFIIDGLDHVHREIGFNDSSLLNELKGSIPDGVYFLLSSQYSTALSQQVLTEIRSDERRFIKVPRFTQHEITQYLRNKGLNEKTLIHPIERVSGGIPLYLHYITELLLKSAVKDHKTILEQLPLLNEGKINTYHQYLYNAIEDNEFAKWVLAVLAYRKEKTTVDVLHQILQLAGLQTTLVDVQNVLKQFSHLLKQSGAKSYSLFHNSFREFILEKSQDLRDRFNRALADYYEQNPFEDEAYRSYFSHLQQLGDYRKIVDTTNLQWIKEAWSHFRSLEEIANNLSTAWHACVELEDLSSFIRIGFLRAQIERLKYTMENTDIDFPILFLRAGLIRHSIRRIWDGDFVHLTHEGFIYYLGEYFDQTGTLLPQDILDQGLSKIPTERGVREAQRAYQVYALVDDDPIALFAEISAIQWAQSSPEHEEEQTQTPLVEEENQRINNKIKEKVVDFLLQHQQFEKLQRLHEAYKGEMPIGICLQTALIKLLLPFDKPSAIELIKSLDPNALDDATKKNLITFSFAYLSNQEVINSFPAPQIEQPVLHDSLIDESDLLHRSIRDAIPAIFEELKLLWTYDPGSARELGVRISALPYDIQDVYQGLYTLSESWHHHRTGETSSAAMLLACKEALDHFQLPKTKNRGKSNFGLFDMPTDDYALAGSLYKLIEVVFRFAVSALPSAEVNVLVDHWRKGEADEDLLHHYTIPLAIAKVIHPLQGNANELLRWLLAHAEQLARGEEDTHSLTETLGKVAFAYGEYGFSVDFRRLYDELPSAAFGLSHRKDYQASFIIHALEAMHETDPSGTLSRLAEVFRIQKQLAAVGNGRMRHIVFSELIQFTIQRYPQLGFHLLEKEERTIERSEALDIILAPLIEKATEEELRLYFAIAQTLPKWTKSDDNHFLSVLQDLLKRAISLQNHAFIDELLTEAKYNADVELEDDKLLKPFAKVLASAGFHTTIAKYHIGHLLLAPPKKASALQEAQPLQAEHLATLFSTDPIAFESALSNQFERFARKERTERFKKEYAQWRKEFLSAVSSLKPGEAFRLVRKLAEIQAQLVGLPLAETVQSAGIGDLLNEFKRETVAFLKNDSYAQFLSAQEGKGYDPASSLAHRFSAVHDLVSAGAMTEEEAIRFVERASILKADQILQFIDNWLKGDAADIALLKLANRLAKVRPDKTKELLERFTSSERERWLFPTDDDAQRLGFDIFETILTADPTFGKRLLLEFYIQRKGRYSDELIANARRLLKYSPFFGEDVVAKAYYEANLQYNQQLAEGLPEASEEYAFITTHKEENSLKEGILSYLIHQFHFPVFKVRELVLQSLYNWLVQQTDDLPLFVQMAIGSGSDHQALYAVMVLRALAEGAPAVFTPLRKELWSLVGRQHFQLLELTRDLLVRLHEKLPGFLTPDERSTLQALNTASPIFLPSGPIVPIERPTPFVNHSFVNDLISTAGAHDNSKTNFKTDVYQHLTRIKNVRVPQQSEELEIHRWYNANTHFDTIEIHTPYDDEMYDSINAVLYAKVRNGAFDEEGIEKLKYASRVWDPSKLLYRPRKKPAYVNWLPDLPEGQFSQFLHAPALLKHLIEREEEYIPLAEYGSQRPGNNDHPTHRNIITFRAHAYLVEKEGGRANQVNPSSSQPAQTNLYAFELPVAGRQAAPQPEGRLLDASFNNFRTMSDLIQAWVTQEILATITNPPASLLQSLVEKENEGTVEAFRWQRAYTDGVGRRRYRPTSEGFTLKMKKSTMQNILAAGNFELWYHLFIQLAGDYFRPETHLNWHRLNEHIRVEDRLE